MEGREGKEISSPPFPPSPPSPPTPPHRILLIQPEWPARALLKAELEERGYQVLGADSVPLAVDLAMKRGFRPDVVVLDASGLNAETVEIERLSFLRGRTPLLTIGSSQYRVFEPESLAPTRQLKRPVTVGEIADAAIELAGYVI